MNLDTIIRLLENSGIKVLNFDNVNIIIEDPNCILRSFETFLEYGWVVLSFITGLFFFGWAVSFIMGAKLNVFENVKNLFLIFGVLSVIGPIINFIYGGDIFAQGCREITVPIATINQTLELRESQMPSATFAGEEFDIYDSAADIGLSDDLSDLIRQIQ